MSEETIKLRNKFNSLYAMEESEHRTELLKKVIREMWLNYIQEKN